MSNIIRYIEAVDALKKSLIFLDKFYQNQVQIIIDDYDARIRNFNMDNFIVSDIKKNELSMVGSSLKKIVKGVYLNPIKKEIFKEHNLRYPESNSYYWDLADEEYDLYCESYDTCQEQYEKVNDLINEKCNNTILSDYVLHSKILHYRETPDYYHMTPLETELNNHIKLLMLKEFEEQNKEFINKHLKIKHYETSK